jgi:arylsulfatase
MRRKSTSARKCETSLLVSASAGRWWPVLLCVLVACETSESRPRHLVVISVDTLRLDRLGAYGSQLGLTPAIDDLAATSVRFTAAYAAAPFTLASMAAFMTGRYPEEIGVVANAAVVPPDVTTLAGWLKARGWRTGGVVSNPALRNLSGIHSGFYYYDATFPQREAVRRLPERTAIDTTTAALAMLEKLAARQTAPVFLWVHFQDPHGPYTPPDDLRDRHLATERRAVDGARRLAASDGDRGFGTIPHYQFQPEHDEVAYYRAGYDGEVEYMDRELGRLLAALPRYLPPAETVIVFTADHGEGLGEDDYWFAHGEYLSDPLVHVPLVVRIPGRRPTTRDDVVSLVDVFPSLARLLGVDVPAGIRGRDLFAPGAAAAQGFAYLATLRESSVPRFGFVRGRVRYVVSLESGGAGGGVLPARDGSGSEDRPDLSAELTAFRRSLRSVPPAEQILSPPERQHLRDLGYLQTD